MFIMNEFYIRRKIKKYIPINVPVNDLTSKVINNSFKNSKHTFQLTCKAKVNRINKKHIQILATVGHNIRVYRVDCHVWTDPSP